MKRKLTQELYRSAFDEVHAPAGLLSRVLNPDPEVKESGRRIVFKRTLVTAAVIVVLAVLSSMIALAATGELRSRRKMIAYDPQEPMENVRAFFIENDAKLRESSDYPRRDYYGGTYLDGGTQVILLTDLNLLDGCVDFGDLVRFEKCEYSYAVLTDAVKTIGELLPPMIRRREGAAWDIVSWSISEKDNCVIVSIFDMDDDKIRWFRNNVCDREYLVFTNADGRPMDLDALPVD